MDTTHDRRITTRRVRAAHASYCCGFDANPSDLGVDDVRAMRARGEQRPRGRTAASSGFSGGTAASALGDGGGSATSVQRFIDDPYALIRRRASEAPMGPTRAVSWEPRLGR